jgi:hypothetical protein
MNVYIVERNNDELQAFEFYGVFDTFETAYNTIINRHIKDTILTYKDVIVDKLGESDNVYSITFRLPWNTYYDEFLVYKEDVISS